MSGYILSVDADFDLDDIWEYIAADRREDLTSYPVLFWPVGAYLIIYRADRRPIEIVAVTQGSRDIPAFLSRRTRH